ncbi:type VI secretion system contractile sheath small subunit [Microvirga sp. SRT01]|jgi:type VI secretion system protein ImpB|uniref:Type VI secretion system contractile sheath small subunit n=1 Tax=Sphingomonas longa TaxID=2778730 RepID=A0ABS2D2H1_9SPHN|nr:MULTISPECIES: type VI secretion system contractile sheath small subunit [Alphaproteobacteria]MBM6575100.1 type VI secretion system contractile sheath small subunit [Sphingomonas sp. BT552]MBR7708151.1 type VI secretion system contractile sheath small subunit [Microvirga sp. SRT01]
MADSVHDKLKRVRKPRVHITYDVETEGAQELKELPFVVGVLGDFSGDSAIAKKALKERKFVDLKKDKFDQVMARIEPAVKLKVDNTVEKNGKEFEVNLKFRSMEDFEPEQIVQQVEPLRKLMETRNALRDLMAKADGSEQLEGLLEKILQDNGSLAELQQQLGVSDAPKE